MKISCKAAIVATGGFSVSEEMLDEYGNIGYSITLGSGSIGEGLKMAWATDANQDGIIMQYLKINFPDMIMDANYTGNLSKLGEFPLLYVNSSGKCFFNEEGVFDSAISANSLASVGGLDFSDFQAEIDGYVAEGVKG